MASIFFSFTDVVSSLLIGVGSNRSFSNKLLWEFAYSVLGLSQYVFLDRASFMVSFLSLFPHLSQTTFVVPMFCVSARKYSLLVTDMLYQAIPPFYDCTNLFSEY